MATIVISYGRGDRPLVRGLVKLLRAGLHGIDRAVYWDDDFEPGESWFDQIEAEIRVTPKLFVMWCEHSASSAQVRRELDVALAYQKRLVPVLLDSTPLMERLAGIHAIDLRQTVKHGSKAVADEPAASVPVGGEPDDPFLSYKHNDMTWLFSAEAFESRSPMYRRLALTALRPVLAIFASTLMDEGVRPLRD